MEGPAEPATPLSDQYPLLPPTTGWNPATRGPLHPRSRVPLPRWGRRERPLPARPLKRRRHDRPGGLLVAADLVDHQL
ncbi:hypothetical protein CA606_11605 [Caulobacter vibrioides]|uniref:Uncharacterized protein n=1 Tax=Caulobacter vibrioides TaxID=155892 RepID=A0A290MZ74_CAUVI|nr:hypothetical protein CA606_11605 [Caulobacter vibrioides]